MIGVVPPKARDRNCGTFRGRLGDEVHGATDAVSIHVGLQGLVDFYRLNNVRRHCIELDLAHSRFGEGTLTPSIVALVSAVQGPRT